MPIHTSSEHVSRQPALVSAWHVQFLPQPFEIEIRIIRLPPVTIRDVYGYLSEDVKLGNGDWRESCGGCLRDIVDTGGRRWMGGRSKRSYPLHHAATCGVISK